MCFFFLSCVSQAFVPGGLGSVLVLVEEQQEPPSHNLEGAEVISSSRARSHAHTHSSVLLISFNFGWIYFFYLRV